MFLCLDALSDDGPHFLIQSILNIRTQSSARLEHGRPIQLFVDLQAFEEFTHGVGVALTVFSRYIL